VKFLPLLVANLLRRKIRLTLTLGSFLVALFLFGLLYTIGDAFSQGVQAAGADRLVIINKVSLIQPLPLSYKEKILRIDGVKQLTYANWFGGVYIDEKNFFGQFAVDHETWRETYPNLKVTDAEWSAFTSNRMACIAGKALADRFEWKVGQRINIRGVIFQGNWEFDLVGIYTSDRPNDDLTQFWFRSDYLREKAPPWARGNVGWYVAKIDPNADVVKITSAIDSEFANSPWETRSQSEQFFMASFAKQMGNIGFLMTAIGSVVFFTLLLVTGNTMAMSVRERTAELAVLKAVGYTDGFVLVLVLLESMIVAVIGGGTGLLLAKAITLNGDPTHMLPAFYLSPMGMALGFAAALSVGLASGVLPAVSAMRLQVVAALRRL
jgi:putative ABC transport system permease protein